MKANAQSAPQSLIDDLEVAIAGKDISARARTLKRVADLFMTSSRKLVGEEVALFDDVMCHLVHAIDTAARAAFGERMLAVDAPPPGVMRELALDDAIEVAGPILSRSDQLSDEVLVEGAATKGQDHLVAIAGRAMIGEAVTDILVERGDRRVVRRVAANPGARFSDGGYGKLVSRAAGDEETTLHVWARQDVPRQSLLRLFVDASEALQRKLSLRDPNKGQLIMEMIAQAAAQMRAKTRVRASGYAEACKGVRALHAAGKLDDGALREFAQGGRFDETSFALALLSGLSEDTVERAMIEDGAEQTIVLARSVDLSWETTKAILQMQTRVEGGKPHQLDHCAERFRKLRPGTAKNTVQFLRLKEQAARSAGKEADEDMAPNSSA